MKVFIIGSGGREHALAWKISQSPKVSQIYCAPGNAGIASFAECVDIKTDNIQDLLNFAVQNSIDLTVVGPELPLSLGLVNRFEKEGLRVFGPRKKAAQIEASKSFSRYIMEKYNIPVAKGASFDDADKAIMYIHDQPTPIVVKADGLAAGKGVIICKTHEEAIDAVQKIMVDRKFGDAGKKVVIEECLVGEEASFLAFTDGKTVVPLPASQDHKAIYDNDQGPNTGGMGAYSPAPIIDRIMHDKIMETIMIPVIQGLHAEGIQYCGVLYAGLMIVRDQIYVLEFNVRFGDPECQPLLMRLKSDLVDIMDACIDGQLERYKLNIDPRPAVCVVMASEGYPESYEKGMVINGLDSALNHETVRIFHAGTAYKAHDIVTIGGRVLGVTALGETVQSAIDQAYDTVRKISWNGCYYRKDIGQKAVERFAQTPQVGIVMGSDSDLNIMKSSAMVFKQFGIPYEMTVASAHRTPDRAARFAHKAEQKGIKVIIAGAGMAAHLAGFLAAHTSLPIIGVPIDSSALQGLDALLSTVQMPPGVPVATMGIGKSGAKNAALFALQVLALSNDNLQQQLKDYKQQMAEAVEAKARAIA
ncbi:MAG: phosphoribosylamine--glycine ligase [Candidatus Magnetoglobus multicellularis str. Araruama]|uniref:Multifunctional fusion protein n=1 Tax=Candidatus Magnetoglobus multicellularis str. Araruama TaxID=890399 RepID=A0A1V1PIC6_9BACT|nr:MAG: phosphoribosylamine--glycine ligase [Candidatus Magnetoglobus multicellularis str. Araruama]